MSERLLKLALRHEDDLVLARQRTREIAQLLAYDRQDQTRLATAVSEIARNAYDYAGGGSIEFSVERGSTPHVFVIDVIDCGAGIAELDAILEGRYRSPTGMGIGISGARRLVDACDIDTSPRGTRVSLRKILPRGRDLLTPAEFARITREMESQVARPSAGRFSELQQQNRELLAAMDELARRQVELERLNEELADTNRGVLALYAELDEKADHLRRADEAKTKFLSEMSHEFRTPLSSILGLSRLLLDNVDGTLTPGQHKQVTYIRRCADDLLAVVNDLLDIAKVEAGKIELRPTEFSLVELFGALRGMLRPLLVAPSVRLVFDDVSRIAPIYSDEGKISQILRNFISNAIKFTETGAICVSARVQAGELEMCVADTGIGIAPEDHELIFLDFTQIDHRLQRRVKGTGLGLPLCRRLAEALGGRVWVESEPERGSRFFLQVPQRLPQAQARTVLGAAPAVNDGSTPVLVIEDRAEDRLIYEKYLHGTGFALQAASRMAAARSLLASKPPAAVILDLLLEDEDAWRLLPEIHQRGIPVIVISSVDEAHKGLGLGADAYGVKPVSRDWLLTALYGAVLRPRLQRVLIADDDPHVRTLLAGLLAPVCGAVAEAADGHAALALAGAARPDLIVLDLSMPRCDGIQTMEILSTQPLPRPAVVVCTSRAPTATEDALLDRYGAVLISKAELERITLLRAVLRLLSRERPSTHTGTVVPVEGAVMVQAR